LKIPVFLVMRIIARSTLREFWETSTEAEPALRAWIDDAAQADWQSPTDIKSTYANASIIANNREAILYYLESRGLSDIS
jgi:mRNA-degrading endonuclease HigB of HigAB toxin-antitoxin module